MLSFTFTEYSMKREREEHQKQPFRGVPRKRCSGNTQQIYRRKTIPKCDFNKVAINLIENFGEIALRHGCSPAAYFQNTFS